MCIRDSGNIVGKYGPQVAAALNRLAPLDIRLLCPLHGSVWRRSLQRLVGYYSRWCRYEPDERAVAVFYGSMYGNTENAADILANGDVYKRQIFCTRVCRWVYAPCWPC